MKPRLARLIVAVAASKEARRNSFVTLAAAGVWLLVVLGAMTYLAGYSNLPGKTGQIPLLWPADSQIPFNAIKPTLIMFAHPHCPCTRASLSELEVLVARCQGQFNPHVVFVRCAGMSKEWTKTDLWRSASAIPGVGVHLDDNGSEARRFGSFTSGQTVLYDQQRHLLFSGGITLSRGHSGDNPGRSAIAALLRHSSLNYMNTPVFGCPLFESDCPRQAETAVCKP